MQNKKRGQATFSVWTAPFIRKNGAWPHFTMKKVACPLYYLGKGKNRKWGLAPF